MPAYYNEIEPYVAEWLRNLIARNLIAPGDVDTRSIIDVQPDDLRGYAQCHFFAGIGGWSYALRLAGWSDDRFVWTGSCPCQPFSTAGKQRGSDDERHLWPAFFRLIRECSPATVFGEQVAGAAGLAWLDHVCADLEGAGYATAAADLPACSVGAPHRRQRLWWVADSSHGDWRAGIWEEEAGTRTNGVGRRGLAVGGADGWLADASRAGPLLSERDSKPQQPEQSAPQGHDADRCGEVCGMADAEHAERRALSLDRKDGRDGPDGGREEAYVQPGARGEVRGRMADTECERGCGGQSGRENAGNARLAGETDPWADIEWLACSDGKARPTQPGLFPLAHGVPGRVGRLRGYGNAIVPPLAAQFIQASLEAMIDVANH